MLNIGQVVYDTTNDRVLLFCGFEMFQNTKTGKCHAESAFIDEDGNFMEFSDSNPAPFKYTNFRKDGKPFIGCAVAELGLSGHFFGVLRGDIEEVKVAAIKAIKNMKEEMAIHGITKQVDKTALGKESITVTIGEVHPIKSHGLKDLAVSAVSQ